jgi:hypothetical protein
VHTTSDVDSAKEHGNYTTLCQISYMKAGVSVPIKVDFASKSAARGGHGCTCMRLTAAENKGACIQAGNTYSMSTLCDLSLSRCLSRESRA